LTNSDDHGLNVFEGKIENKGAARLRRFNKCDKIYTYDVKNHDSTPSYIEFIGSFA
jgi:hypothetical protein